MEHFKQETDYSCGLASVRMVLSNFNISLSENELKEPLNYFVDGIKSVWHKDMLKFFVDRNFIAFMKSESSIADIINLLNDDYSVIVSYYIPREQVDHYSVVNFIDGKRIHFYDSWFGKNHSYTHNYFIKNWFDLEGEKSWLLGLKK